MIDNFKRIRINQELGDRKRTSRNVITNAVLLVIHEIAFILGTV